MPGGLSLSTVCYGIGGAVCVYTGLMVVGLLVSGPTHFPLYRLFGLRKPKPIVKGFVAPGYEKVRICFVYTYAWGCVHVCMCVHTCTYVCEFIHVFVCAGVVDVAHALFL
jgi:hypothetical protein